MVTYQELSNKYFEKLDMFSMAITRAHGKSHPETFEVRELYEKITKKIEQNSNDSLNLDEEFKQLRKITDNYTIPDDVCETYEATYNMLLEIDEAYSA